MVNPKLKAIIRAVIDTAPISMDYGSAEALNALDAYDEGDEWTYVAASPFDISHVALSYIDEHVKVAVPIDYDGYTCPHCLTDGSTRYDGVPRRVGSTLLQPRACRTCSAIWDDMYKLTGCTHIKRPVGGNECAS